MDVFLTLRPNFRFPVLVGIIKIERQIKDKFLLLYPETVYVNLEFILMRKVSVHAVWVKEGNVQILEMSL